MPDEFSNAIELLGGTSLQGMMLYPWRLACGLFLALFVAAAQSQQPSPSKDPKRLEQLDPDKDIAPQLRKFIDVLSAVESQSADKPSVDKIIYEGAIPSMLRTLDPHTQFFEPSQFQQLQHMEQSEQKGFGSIVSVLPGQVIFLQIFPGTPTSKAGIQPGDELIAVNSIGINSLTPDQIIELLTEARQQKITAYIRRKGAAKLLPILLTPELMDTPSVDRVYMLSPGVGYVRVASWDVLTYKQLRDALDKLNGPSLQGLVIDLRNNPGGIVKSALDVAALFLKPGERILTAKSRTGVVESADVPKNAKPLQCKLAILVNGKTASASEIFAGALQDHDRAVIVGETSYGKGLVQSVMPLSDGAGLAITTAFYYTPSGRSIQHPLRDSALSQTFGGTPESALPTYKTDSGRVVTGGGGIHPDVRVDPAGHTKLESVIDASGTATSFASDYLASHTPLPEKFAITPAIVDDFKVYLAARQIQPSVGEWSGERDWISERLLEEVVTQAKGVAAGDEISAKRDPQVQAALHAIEGGTALAGAVSY